MVSRRWVLGGLSLGLVLLAASAGAESPFRRREYPAPFHVSLEDAGGRELPSYFHAGRQYVLGDEGRRYVIRLDNPTGERVEAVVSVDGRDAISGRVGDYRRERGYVLPAYGSLMVEGFRRSLSDVAAFRFADPSRSYSSRLGTPENVGVIGVAYYGERRRVVRSEPRRPVVPRPASPQRYRDDASPAADRAPGDGRGASELGADRAEARKSKGRPSAPEPESRGRVRNLGTEYGETRESRVNEVAFERRSSEPDWVVTLHYDDADGLSARGIELWPEFVREPFSAAPEPFPNSRFAEPPP